MEKLLVEAFGIEFVCRIEDVLDCLEIYISLAVQIICTSAGIGLMFGSIHDYPFTGSIEHLYTGALAGSVVGAVIWVSCIIIMETIYHLSMRPVKEN